MEETTAVISALSRRRLLRGAGLTLTGAALAACSGSGEAGTPSASKPPVTLSFLSWRPIAMDQFFRPPAQYPYQHAQVFSNVYKRPYGIIWSHYRAGDNATTWGAEFPKIVRGEVAVSSGLKEMERLLNQQIEYGGGDNPFKGVRWPIQPK